MDNSEFLTPDFTKNYAWMENEVKKDIKNMPLGEMAEEALKKAVARVVEEHRKSAEPLVVWRDGERFACLPINSRGRGGNEGRSSPSPRSKMSHPLIIFKKVHPVDAYF